MVNLEDKLASTGKARKFLGRKIVKLAVAGGLALALGTSGCEDEKGITCKEGCNLETELTCAGNYHPLEEECCIIQGNLIHNGCCTQGENLFACTKNLINFSSNEGLTWDGKYFWTATEYDNKTNTTYGYIRNICQFSNYNNIINCFDSPGKSSFGLAWDGEYLWNLGTDKENQAIFKMYKLASNGEIVDSFNLPSEDSGWVGSGLAWDGNYFWSVGYPSKIYKFSPTGEIVDYIASPANTSPNLAWDGQYLWESDKNTGKIYKLTTTGEVMGSFDSPLSNPSGLAWDGESLWNASKNNDKIYELKIIQE